MTPLNLLSKMIQVVGSIKIFLERYLNSTADLAVVYLDTFPSS